METYNYLVDDSESGEVKTYKGPSLKEAKAELLRDIKDGQAFDLSCNGERVWCGVTDSVDELKKITEPPIN